MIVLFGQLCYIIGEEACRRQFRQAGQWKMIEKE